MVPVYLETFSKGKLQQKIKEAYQILAQCTLCPRKCKVNRLKGETGVCNTGSRLIVSSYGPHYGEESPLVGRYGSGTIFLTNCNLKCLFCQNYDISHLGYGTEVSAEEFAQMMLSLQKRGCHNINLVTPTHQMPMIIEALELAIKEGLSIPLVYNCGGYESIEAIRLLEGIVDIYMPDFKYWEEKWSRKFSKAPHYKENACAVLKEMHRQVGDLIIKNGIAEKGLLIRHLVMPNNIAGTKELAKWIAQELSPNTYINVMDQYRPCYKANEHPEINRRLTMKEFEEAVKWMKEAGIKRLDKEVAPRRFL